MSSPQVKSTSATVGMWVINVVWNPYYSASHCMYYSHIIIILIMIVYYCDMPYKE